MATIAKTLTLTKLVNQFKKPDTGHMVLIRDLSGNAIATATETPALSGQYIAYFAEPALGSSQYGFWFVDGVKRPEFSNNSPFWCGKHDTISGSGTIYSSATIPTFTGNTTFNNNVTVDGDLEVSTGTFTYANGPTSGYVLTTDAVGNTSWTDPALSFGTSGTTGTSGTSGAKGDAGSSGTSGADGTFFGSSGTSGTTFGSSGTSGVTGTAGTSGATGSSGTSGANGSSGTSGKNGSNGTSGTSASSLGIRTTSTTAVQITALGAYTWTVASATGLLVRQYVRLTTILGAGIAEGLITLVNGLDITVDISFHNLDGSTYSDWTLEVLVGQYSVTPVPAGINGEVQFNDSGTWGTALGFLYDKNSRTLTASGSLHIVSTGSIINRFGNSDLDWHIFSGSIVANGPLSASQLQFVSGATPNWVLTTAANGSAYWQNPTVLGGSSGTSGTAGTSGQTGSSGTSGQNGSSGTSGQNGSSGTSGQSGTHGSSGSSGDTYGTSGTSGVSGTGGGADVGEVELIWMRMNKKFN